MVFIREAKRKDTLQNSQLRSKPTAWTAAKLEGALREKLASSCHGNTSHAFRRLSGATDRRRSEEGGQQVMSRTDLRALLRKFNLHGVSGDVFDQLWQSVDANGSGGARSRSVRR